MLKSKMYYNGKNVLIFPLSHWGSFQSGQKDSRLCICWLTGKSVSAIHPFSNTTSSELGGAGRTRRRGTPWTTTHCISSVPHL